jgi:hypothetical protein
VRRIVETDGRRMNIDIYTAQRERLKDNVFSLYIGAQIAKCPVKDSKWSMSSDQSSLIRSSNHECRFLSEYSLRFNQKGWIITNSITELQLSSDFLFSLLNFYIFGPRRKTQVEIARLTNAHITFYLPTQKSDAQLYETRQQSHRSYISAPPSRNAWLCL